MDLRGAIPQFFFDWWPAMLLALIAYYALGYILRRSRSQPRLEGIAYDLHQLKTSLGCTEHQARTLLASYDGNAVKAIQEVKTGKATLPAAAFGDVAQTKGDVRGLQTEPELGVLLRNGEQVSLDVQARGLLVLGVVNPDARADRQGLARADRGTTYAQLFWESEDGWSRFLLDSKRLDYFCLGERKQNAAIRNFKLLLKDFIDASPQLTVHKSVNPFLKELHAPLHKTLAELDSLSAGVLNELKSN